MSQAGAAGAKGVQESDKRSKRGRGSKGRKGDTRGKRQESRRQVCCRKRKEGNGGQVYTQTLTGETACRQEGRVELRREKRDERNMQRLECLHQRDSAAAAAAVERGRERKAQLPSSLATLSLFSLRDS